MLTTPGANWFVTQDTNRSANGHSSVLPLLVNMNPRSKDVNESPTHLSSIPLKPRSLSTVRSGPHVSAAMSSARTGTEEAAWLNALKASGSARTNAPSTVDVTSQTTLHMVNTHASWNTNTWAVMAAAPVIATATATVIAIIDVDAMTETMTAIEVTSSKETTRLTPNNSDH
jgi:hypothetical protein